MSRDRAPSAAAARTCTGCGVPLSRYNPDDRCSRCQHAVPPQPTPKPEPPAGSWLTRASDEGPDGHAGAVLRRWRVVNGKSQAELADELGITQQHLSLLETGRRPLSLEQRRLVVERLGVPPEDLGLASARSTLFVARDDASEEILDSRTRWRAERRWLNRHRAELAQLAVGLYPPEQRVAGSPLIAQPDCVSAEPVELHALRLTLDEGPQQVVVDGSEPETLPVRPLRVAGASFERYTSAVRHLDPPRLFESRPSYRLLEACPAERRLGFGLAAYFDKLDVSEALGHEMAAACSALGGIPSSPAQLDGALPFRDLVGDPFDTARRAMIPAVTTLTVTLRRHPAEPTFLLHWRDPANVATAAGVYDVVPAGEFQPSSVALWDRRNDFDLWRNIVREYSEELLGESEHDGTRSAPLAYECWDLYQQLEQARRRGDLTAFLLGIGMDALTLAATILTVVVIDEDTFGRVLGATVRYNEEGEIVALGDGRPADGVPFTAGAVERLLSSEPMASPGAACLALAWRHRGWLVGA